jgi:MFS family permease
MVRKMTGYQQLARNRDFSILWVGETISELGSTMSLFVFPLLGYHLTGSTLVAAVLEGAGLLGMVAMMLPAGLLADRFDRRALMIGASATGAALYGSLVLAGLLGGLTVPHLGVVALLTGVAQGVFQPAQMAAIRRVVATDELATALSQNQARQHVAALLGGPLGGALYAVRAWAPFAVDAVSYGISCVTLSRIRTGLRPHPREGAPTGPVEQVKEGYRFIRRQPFFRTLMVWASLNNLVVNACFFVVMMRLVRQGVQPAQIGLVSTSAGVGGILGALAAPYVIDRLRTGTLTVVVGWMCVLPLVPLLWWSTTWAACASVFAILVMNPSGNAGIGAYRTAMTPDDLQGRVGSALSFVTMGTLPLAPVLGGFLLGKYGGQAAIAGMVAASVLTALIPTFSRSMNSVPRPAEWAATESAPMRETAPEGTGATCA